MHDSYWTHAGSIDEMSAAIRDAFVHLHSSNVLENLLTEFKERYKGYKVPIDVFKKRSNLAAIANSPRYKEVKELVGEALEEEGEEVEEGEEAEEVEEGVNEKKGRKKGEKKQKDLVPFFDSEKPRTERELKEVEEVLKERFVDLVDVFPPIPEKGEFDIQVIRESLYFFS